MTDAAMLNYYRTIADRSALPVVIYSIPKFTHYDISVAVVAELANHRNILGIEDLSGNVEQIRGLVEATRGVAKRTVTVTPIFEAVTGRMLAAAAVEASGSFVLAESLGTGATALAVAPPVARPATRTREIGFQVLLVRVGGEGQGIAGGGCERLCAGHGSLCAAVVHRGLCRMERQGCGAGGGEAGASGEGRAACGWSPGYCRD